MISKKEKKVILISAISLILIAVIAISAVFIIRSKTKKGSDETPPPVQSSPVTFDSNSSNKDIALGNIPYEYNNFYVFKSVYLSLATNLSHKEKQALFYNEGVSDLNGLSDKIKQSLSNRAKNGEVLCLQNGNINTTTLIETEEPVVKNAGTYIGNKDLALVIDNETKEQYYISLTNKNKDSATAASNMASSSSPAGTSLFVFKKLYSPENPELALINITIEYEIYVEEEPFNPGDYDIDIDNI